MGGAVAGSVRLAADLRRRCAPTRKSRSAPRVGLQDVVDVEPLPAARPGRRTPRPWPGAASRAASSSSGTSSVEPPAGDVQRRSGRRSRTSAERAAGGRLGGDVQHDRAVRGAAHPAVADPHHVAHALREQLRRQRHVGHLGHARVALRPAAAQHQHRVGVDVEVRVVDPGVQVLDRVEDDAPGRGAAAGPATPRPA